MGIVDLSLPGGNAGLPPMRIDPDKLDSYVCKQCAGEVFSQQFLLKRISPLQSGQPTETIVPVPIFICLNCGAQLHIDRG